MNKTIGLVLVTVGLGLTAGCGAFLSPNYRSALVVQGEATFSDAAVDQAFVEYCESRRNNRLDDKEGCGDSAPLVAPSEAEGLSKVELRLAQVDAMESSAEVLLIDVSMARVTYKVALKKSLKLWRAVDAAGTQGPGDRLSGWFGVGGAGFGLGLLLLAVGALMCRRASVMDADPTESNQDGPVDFGVLLASVLDNMSVMVQHMESLDAPNMADVDECKRRLEEVQKGDMARLCACGPLVQRRYGLQGMAALFSPLSAAERKMNRAWAALVDRHWPEALASVRSAATDLETAQVEIEGLQHARAKAGQGTR